MRKYSSESSNQVKYFVGYEEVGLHTYKNKFLGVVGLQPYEEVITKAIEHGCNYILLGANKSFDPTAIDDDDWYDLIENILINTQLSVILSMNINNTGLFDINRLKKHPKFHMQLYIVSVGIEEYPTNTTLVFEDRLWEQNNRMLYSTQISNITKSENGVPWDRLTQDVIIQKNED